MAFDHIRIAFFDKARQALDRARLGFLGLRRVHQDHFLPAAVIGKGNAGDVILRRLRQIAFARGRDHFDLQALHFLQRHAFEQGPPGVGEVVLHRVGQREKNASRALQAVAQRDQFFPTVDRDQPVELEIAGELLRVLHPEIGDVGVRPDERPERLHLDRGAAVLLATINAHRASVAHLDRDDSQRRIGAEEQQVIRKSHRPNDGTSSLSFRAAVDGEEPPNFRTRVTHCEVPLRAAPDRDDKL